MKKDAKKVLRHHYVIFVMLCLIAGIFGIEYTSSLSITKSQTEISYENETVTEVTTGAAGITDRFIEILADMGSGKEEQVKKEADRQIQEEVQKSEQNKNAVLGRSRGVLSGVVNKVSSGKYVISVVVAIRSMVGSNSAAIAILVLLSLLLYFLVKIFGVGIYYVTIRRMFLEARCYDKVYTQRASFLIKTKKWVQASVTILVQSIYELLWMCTIVGGIIKYYSYYMVPYIVAENPGIKPNVAITLSRNLMKGHKWECFLFEMSFLGWSLLGAITFGLTDIFWANPYQAAAFCEYYAEIRRIGKEKGLKHTELLNDEYLFRRAEDSVLQEAYQDVVLESREPVSFYGELSGLRKFLAGTFGVVIWNGEKERAFAEHQSKIVRLFHEKQALEGGIYPVRLSPIPVKHQKMRNESLNYIRCYSIGSLIMIFFIMSVIGWLWEVSLHLIEDGTFVNRGVLHGPWLPIYGSGGVLILVLLNKFRKNPALEFGATILLCGIVEYFTAYYLEVVNNGKKWWDYSGYFLNLHGRICAEGLLVFGVGGMAIVYLLAPLLDNLIQRIPLKILVAAGIVLVSAFVVDEVYSFRHPNEGRGITDYQTRIEENNLLYMRELKKRDENIKYYGTEAS